MDSALRQLETSLAFFKHTARARKTAIITKRASFFIYHSPRRVIVTPPRVSVNYAIAKKEMKDPKSITMKNGKPATQGTCPTCGTKMFRIGKS